MAREDYESVIGLEVHAELSTKTKIFCSCPTAFGAKPNTQVCPICMAMPGTLPVLNEKVVEYAVKAGLATNCTISRNSKNDRKNYYYPDLPKSYQISQYDKPLCENGEVKTDWNEEWHNYYLKKFEDKTVEKEYNKAVKNALFNQLFPLKLLINSLVTSDSYPHCFAIVAKASS